MYVRLWYVINAYLLTYLLAYLLSNVVISCMDLQRIFSCEIVLTRKGID